MSSELIPATIGPKKARRQLIRGASRSAIEAITDTYSIKLNHYGYPVLTSLTTLSQVQSMLLDAAQLESRCIVDSRFFQADVFNQTGDKYGDKYKWVLGMCGGDEELADKKYKDLKNYAWIARKWPADLRTYDYWSHYKKHKPGDKVDEKGNFVSEPQTFSFVAHELDEPLNTIKVEQTENGLVIYVPSATTPLQYLVQCKAYPLSKDSK